jgi:hypothetical protein
MHLDYRRQIPEPRAGLERGSDTNGQHSRKLGGMGMDMETLTPISNRGTLGVQGEDDVDESTTTRPSAVYMHS